MLPQIIEHFNNLKCAQVYLISLDEKICGCTEIFCHQISLFSAEMTIIVTALLCRDVNTTSSWCCASSLKPFSMVMLKIVFPSQLKQLVIIVQSVLNLSKKKKQKCCCNISFVVVFCCVSSMIAR